LPSTDNDWSAFDAFLSNEPGLEQHQQELYVATPHSGADSLIQLH